MKKKFFSYAIFIILILVMVGAVFLNFNKKGKNNITKVKVAEVAHTIFYAPQYVAIEKGYFEDNGILIDLVLTPGADKVTAAVLSGDVDIGFCGSEGTIYVYNGGEKNYLKTFAQLTQKDGSFLVSRKKYDIFSLDDLKGKEIIGGRAGGMPEMTFEWALKKSGIDPKKDVKINTSIAFAAMGGAFIGGQGDFVTLFEPTALELEQQGYGHVVASIGELGGTVPYTSYSAKSDYIEKNKNIIKKFKKAIQEGLDFVHNHSDREIAQVIIKQFPNTSIDDLERVIKRYREIDAWPKMTNFSEESFYHLQDIMISNNLLKEKIPYSKLIYDEK